MAVQMQPLKIPKSLGFPKLMVGQAGGVYLAIDEDMIEETIDVIVLSSANGKTDVGDSLELDKADLKDLPVGETVTLFNKGD
jgi:hypothetical protein